MREDIQENLDMLYEDVKNRADGPSSKDIIHVQERADGSSDGLLEKMDIDLGNGYKECSNWNKDFHQERTGKELTGEELNHKNRELTAVQLVEVFNISSEMGILEKRAPILNKLKEKDLQKLNKLYEIYKKSEEKNK